MDLKLLLLHKMSNFVLLLHFKYKSILVPKTRMRKMRYLIWNNCSENMCRFPLAVIILLNILLWMKILNSCFPSVASVLYLLGSEKAHICLNLWSINSPEFLDIFLHFETLSLMVFSYILKHYISHFMWRPRKSERQKRWTEMSS